MKFEFEADEGLLLHHVADLWFEDGNLVLQAGKSLFRISKGVLMARSPVFADMLAFPQPRVQDVVEGCPLVHLHDAADDVTYFLRAIYDSSFFEPPPTMTQFDIVAGILRLSTKYEVEYLRHRAIRHLDTLYPLSLEAFDKRQETRTSPWKDNTAFFASLLAREVDVPWILPSVLYCVCSCPVKDIVDGFMWNKTIMEMDKGDRGACLRALIPLTIAEHKDVLSFLKLTDVEGCSSPSACNRARLVGLRSVDESRDILNPLDSFYDTWEWFSTNTCGSCFAKSKALHDGAKEALWASLPAMFCLPSWESLVELKREAMSRSYR